MSDGAFSDRVTQLKNRWDADPTSRIFLQLAEEYRHQGRVKEALEVLDRGLKEHPGYLSALVAKGRCHLELGEPEPARTVLERVVKQDATQMVANKLLVRAYLDTGEPERARERLDLYSLLNDSDPEIEELRRRLRAMEQPPQPPPTSDSPFQAAPPGPGDVFDLGFPAAAPVRQGGDLFELDVPVAPVARPAAPAAPAPAVAAPVAAVAVAEAEEEPEPAGVVFPGLASRESRNRYLRALAAEGLFAFDLTEVAAAAPVPVEPEPVEPMAFHEESAVLEPLPALEELEDTVPALEALEEPFPLEEPAAAAAGFSWELAEEPAPAPAAPEPIVSAPPAEAAPAAPAATVTLGDLYLRQNHLGEAKRIFEEVLRREPDNAAAQEGLAHLASRELPPLTARDLLAGYEPGEEGGEMEAKARKAFLLNSYLKRLRRGSQRDVS